MPAKAPIYLKPNNNKKGKKFRLRDILSPDMISPPLGDFRHTIHIGKGGERDAFGDMSFLQGKYELLPGKGDVLPQYGIQSEFLRANSTGDASFAETPSPVLKNAISLPTIGGCQALTLPLISSTVLPMPPEPLEDIMGSSVKPESTEEVEILQMDTLLRSIDVFISEPSSPNSANRSLDSYMSRDSFDSELSKCNGEWVDRDSGVEEGRICDLEFEFFKEKSMSEDSLTHITGSLLSLELDLGPSILDDVLNIMDK
uniref:CDC42 effector protein (Rho GTPase binding) 3 n=1 Tax=Gasterosteus aculeatus TaxID=69293 RepID=G3NF19_GASAC